MDISTQFRGRESQIVALFTAAFTASEGADEGALVGDLARDLLAGTPPDDLNVFVAEEDGCPIGAAIFTRLAFAQDTHTVFLLSPMAVATDLQGTGMGQALLSHALAALRAEGVDVAITYGDPAFYGKVGFVPMDPATVPPPFALSQPHGWIGRSLSSEALPSLAGPSRCVAALQNPALW